MGRYQTYIESLSPDVLAPMEELVSNCYGVISSSMTLLGIDAGAAGTHNFTYGIQATMAADENYSTYYSPPGWSVYPCSSTPADETSSYSRMQLSSAQVDQEFTFSTWIDPIAQNTNPDTRSLVIGYIWGKTLFFSETGHQYISFTMGIDALDRLVVTTDWVYSATISGTDADRQLLSSNNVTNRHLIAARITPTGTAVQDEVTVELFLDGQAAGGFTAQLTGGFDRLDIGTIPATQLPRATTPTSNFVATTAVTGDNPLSVQFDSSSYTTGNIVSWLWNFGDGGTATIADPIYQYEIFGTYSVSLTVTINDGDSNTLTRTDYIVVTEAPPSGFCPLLDENGDTLTDELGNIMYTECTADNLVDASANTLTDSNNQLIDT